MSPDSDAEATTVRRVPTRHSQTNFSPARRAKVGAFGSLPPFARLLRVENGFLVGLLVLLGSRLVAPGFRAPARSIVAASALATVVVWFANVVNDVFDKELDSIGKPWRPIPSRSIPESTARRVGLLLLFVALGLLTTLPAGHALVGLVLLGMAFLYSARLKRVPVFGHVVVAVSTASAVLFGASLSGPLRSPVIIVASQVFCAILLLELAKSASDAWHDRLKLRTLASTLTARSMWIVLLLAQSLALVVSFPLAATLTSSRLGYALVLGATIAPQIPVIVHLIRTMRDPNFGLLERYLDVSKYVWMPMLIVWLLAA